MTLLCKMDYSQATEISPLIGVGQELFNFKLGDISQNKKEMSLDPNMSGVSRIGLNAYGFGLGYSFRGSSKDLDPNLGTTTFYDLQLGYQDKNWGGDIFYQSYTGFYSKDTQNVQLFPDLQFQHIGLVGRYALTESEFTVNALMDQSDSITKSASKYYLVSGIHQHSMENKTSLLQQDYSGLNVELEDLRKLKVDSFSFGIGAGKYWVSDSRLFFGGLLDLVGTYGLYTYENTITTTSNSYGTLSYDLKLGVGYSGQSFKSGISLSSDVTTLKTPGNSYFQASAMRILFYLRFVL